MLYHPRTTALTHEPRQDSKTPSHGSAGDKIRAAALQASCACYTRAMLAASVVIKQASSPL